MDDRELETRIASARMAIGAGLFLLPGLAARAWLGAGAKRPATKTMTRAMGMRDLAIGLGALRAMQRGESTRGWQEAALLSDLADGVATLLSWRHLPRAGRLFAAATAFGAAAINARLLGSGAVPTPRP